MASSSLGDRDSAVPCTGCVQGLLGPVSGNASGRRPRGREAVLPCLTAARGDIQAHTASTPGVELQPASGALYPYPEETPLASVSSKLQGSWGQGDMVGRGTVVSTLAAWGGSNRRSPSRKTSEWRPPHGRPGDPCPPTLWKILENCTTPPRCFGNGPRLGPRTAPGSETRGGRPQSPCALRPGGGVLLGEPGVVRTRVRGVPLSRTGPLMALEQACL